MKLKVHEEMNYLMWEDGSPFFYLGDTAWEMVHQLTISEIEYYLEVRKNQGFNVIQVVALAEFDGLETPNAYGHRPLEKTEGQYDPCKPCIKEGQDYWKHLDDTIQLAASKGLFIGLLPTWGDKYNLKWGKGPEIFDEQNAYVYGRWLANRYRNNWNIIWIIGGDRPLETDKHCAIIDSMARGIKEVDDVHLMTFHPNGTCSSVDYVCNKDYIDFHMVQSGHGIEAYDSYQLLRKTKKRENKPVIDGEPRYEDHPVCFKAELGVLWDAQDVRNNAYWNLMEGVCGHVYGNHATWAFKTNADSYWAYNWHEVMNHPGAEQMKYLFQLRMMYDYYSFRPFPEIVEQHATATSYQSAGRGNNYAYIYTPIGQPILANLDVFGGSIIKASWFNPSNGELSYYKTLPAKQCLCVPPATEKDWVLVLEKID